MYNWNKVFTENDFTYLLKNQDDVDNFTVMEFVNAADMLMDSYINAFGFSKQFKRFLKIRVLCVNLKIEYLKTSNRFLINKINALESEIESLKKLLFQGSKTDFEKQLVNMEKWYGMPIDLKVTTVKKFYVINEQYVAANKQESNSRRGRS